MEPQTTTQILLTNPWFKNIPPSMQDMLLKKGRTVRLDTNERLFSRGNQPCGIYAVLSGCMRITGVGSNGKEAILTMIEPAYWFGEIALFDGKTRTHDAKAEVPTTLWRLPQNSLTEALENNPEWWRHFAQLLTHKLRLAFQAMEDVTLLPANLRLARRLAILSGDSGTGSDPVRNRTLELPQEVLGAMLGISRQTTNQILRDLEQKGMIRLKRSRITITNPSALQQYSDQSLS